MNYVPRGRVAGYQLNVLVLKIPIRVPWPYGNDF